MYSNNPRGQLLWIKKQKEAGTDKPLKLMNYPVSLIQLYIVVNFPY